MARLMTVIAVLGSALAVGCGGPVANPCAQAQADAGLADFQCSGSATISLAKLQTDVFTPSCATAGCHVAGGIGTNDMSTVAKSALTVGKDSVRGSGLKVADPSNLANSTVWLKVLGGTPAKSTYAGPGCLNIGGAMPNDGSSITLAQVNEIKGWICSGAPKQ